MLQDILDLAIIATIAGLWIVAGVIADPEAQGRWSAKRDIAYNEIWVEYITDCDCTEPLE
jgi:uncharacterized membrane protein